MVKKRKSDATRLDEVDRGMYTTFCSAANSLSQLYSQAIHQQRLSFQAGETHSLEKLYNWILRQQQDGLRVVTGDILTYMQNEVDYGRDEPPPPMSPRQQHSQVLNQSGFLLSGNSDQIKNSVFSNALSSPPQGGYNNNATRSNENSLSSNDTSMDMHAESPRHYYSSY